MSEDERKSAEPTAARVCLDPDRVSDQRERLTYFTRCGDWGDHDVRREAARYALAAMSAHQPVSEWTIDDTGFMKQRTHSLGVQRRYSGLAGKVAHRQIGFSLILATARHMCPSTSRCTCWRAGRVVAQSAWPRPTSTKRSCSRPSPVRLGHNRTCRCGWTAPWSRPY